MSLLKIPNELLLTIAQSLTRPDLNSFCKANQRICALLTSSLYDSMDVGYTFEWAVFHCRSPLLRITLAKGANITETWRCGRTALHQAVELGDEDTINTLLELGADINVRNYGIGSRPLHSAVKNNNETVVRLLIERGATIDDVRDRISPLTVATECGHLEIVRILLDAGADANIRRLVNRAPLHTAVLRGNWEITKLLVEKGANVMARDFAGESAIEMAKRLGHTYMEMFLINCSIMGASAPPFVLHSLC